MNFFNYFIVTQFYRISACLFYLHPSCHLKSVWIFISYETLKAYKLYTKRQLTSLSISPTFYEQPLRQNPFAKKLQTQTVSTQKLRKKLWYKKAARKILVKLTPGDRLYPHNSSEYDSQQMLIEKKWVSHFLISFSLKCFKFIKAISMFVHDRWRRLPVIASNHRHII